MCKPRWNSSLTGTKSVTPGTYWRGRTILPLQKCVVAGAAARNLILVVTASDQRPDAVAAAAVTMRMWAVRGGRLRLTTCTIGSAFDAESELGLSVQTDAAGIPTVQTKIIERAGAKCTTEPAVICLFEGGAKVYRSC